MLIPSDKNYPAGFKRYKARVRYHRMEDKTTPEARAAHGRVMYHNHQTPEGDIETVAWHREAGSLGLWNRTQRKKRKS